MSSVKLSDKEVIILKILTARGEYKDKNREGHIWHSVKMLNDAANRGRHYVQHDAMEHLVKMKVAERGRLRGVVVFRITTLGLQELKSRRH